LIEVLFITLTCDLTSLQSIHSYMRGFQRYVSVRP